MRKLKKNVNPDPDANEYFIDDSQSAGLWLYQAKILLQSPLDLDHFLELDGVKHQASILLKGLPSDKKYTLELVIREGK